MYDRLLNEVNAGAADHAVIFFICALTFYVFNIECITSQRRNFKIKVPYRIGYIPAAVAKSTSDRQLAEAFIGFLTGSDGRAIFRKWRYLTTEAEARQYAEPDTPVGGEWQLPETWK